MLRGALIGVGHVARNGHLPEWLGRPETTLVAAADARSDGRVVFLAAFPAARWHAAAEDLLSGETLDFVDICTPPWLHARIVRAALGAGCHVLCEKPLVVSDAELPALAALARSQDRALVTVHNWKHAPALARITQLLREGTIGAIRRLRWETLRSQPAVAAGEKGNWRVDPAQSGGGILTDHGWHALYVLRQWLGGAPASVAARLETRQPQEPGIEDTATLQLAWDGADCEVFLTWAASERRNRVVIEGERGRLTLDGGRIALEGGAGSRRSWDLPSIAEGSHHPDWFRGVVQEFLAEVADPAARGRNLEEATLCAALLALSRESSRQGAARLAVPPQ